MELQAVWPRTPGGGHPDGIPRYALFVAIPAIGHLMPLLRQARELTRRGWRTAIASTEEVRAHVEARHPEMPFVGLGTYPGAVEASAQAESLASAEPDAIKGTMAVMRWVNTLWPVMYDGLRAATEDDRPDVMVVDLVTAAGMDAAEEAGIPYVVNNADLLQVISVGVLPPAPGVPLLFSGRSIHSGGRLRRVLDPLACRLAVAVVEATLGRQLNALRRTRGLAPVAITKRPAGVPIMTDSAFGLEYPRPLPPQIEMVGPMLEDPRPLPDDLRSWLEGGPPVVYVNLGTVVRPRPDVLARIAAGLAGGGFRALWVVRPELRGALPAELPPNVRLETWVASQQAVLAHPAVRVFVTHCGINSVHESLAGGTPMVGIPFLADQRDMAVRVRDAGVGLQLDTQRFTAAELLGSIRRVLGDPAFRRNIPAIQASFARAGGVRRAADLIERAAGAGGGEGHAPAVAGEYMVSAT
jgi:UDP:flavonoid glycosyltransferase YjiC (YdhE family)